MPLKSALNFIQGCHIASIKLNVWIKSALSSQCQLQCFAQLDRWKFKTVYSTYRLFVLLDQNQCMIEPRHKNVLLKSFKLKMGLFNYSNLSRHNLIFFVTAQHYFIKKKLFRFTQQIGQNLPKVT